MQTRSEQEAQIQLLIDSAVALESQGQSVSLEVMSGLAGVNTQDIGRYLSPLSTLPSGMAMLFAGVCALIARQGEAGIEDQADSSTVGPNPVAGSIFTSRQLGFLFQCAITL